MPVRSGTVRSSRTIECRSSMVMREPEGGASSCRLPADEHRSIIGYLRAKPRRSRNEHPTNCGRLHRSTLRPSSSAQAKIHTSACAWIAVDTKTVAVRTDLAEFALKEFFG